MCNKKYYLDSFLFAFSSRGHQKRDEHQILQSLFSESKKKNLKL